MDRDDLFEDFYHWNGTPRFFVDKDCTMPFTGLLEEYHNGRLIYEVDIVDGLENGISKYYEEEIICIQGKYNNEMEGLSVGYDRKPPVNVKIIF